MSQIQGSFCYNGKEFGIVDEETLVQIGGNNIILWNFGNGKKDYIPCPRRNGYSCVTTSYNNGLVAAAENGLGPSCQIYQMPSKRLIADFKMKTTLKCVGMNFSRDGKYLLMIGGIPDFNISIYDLENKKFLITEELKLKHRNDFLSVKFNPRSKLEFCILSKQNIQFYSMVQAFQFLDNAEGAVREDQSEGGGSNFIDSWRFDVQEFDSSGVPVTEGDNARVNFESLIWDSQNRVLLCTNQRALFQVTSKSPHIGKTLDLKSPPLTSVMTPKHLIVSEESGMINWYKIDQPFDNAKPEDKFITIKDDIDKEYNFKDALSSDMISPAHFMVYSKSHKNLLLGTRNGVLSLLNVPAEKVSDEDYEQEGQEEQKQTVLENVLQKIGSFHTAKVNAVKPLGGTTQMVSISDDQTVAIWEVTTQQRISCIRFPGEVVPISLDVSKEGSVVFIGTQFGTFRTYDITNREKPRLIQQLKFYEDEKPITQILSSEDGKTVFISSKESDTFYVMSQEASNGFAIYGHIQANGLILSIGNYQHEGKSCALALLSNNLIESYIIPTEIFSNRLIPIPQSVTKSAVRKVDPGSDFVMSNKFSRHYMVSGEDLVLKIYESYPNDAFENIDWKKPAVKPSIEMKDSHALGTTCYSSNGATKTLVTGGLDGVINVRSIESVSGNDAFEAHLTFSAHSVLQGGVVSIAIDQSGKFIYSSGGDGSIMVHSVSGASLPHMEIPFENSKEINYLQKVPTVQPQPYDELTTVTQYMEQEFAKSNDERKRTFRNEIMKELNGIQNNLRELLSDNNKVSEIEKLQRDEFVIDTAKADELWKKGEDVCNDIRKKAEMTSLTMQLLKERVKAATWDQMEVQSKACKSIRSEKLIYNYAIRKRTPLEYKRLQHIMIQRRIELGRKLDRMERRLVEVVDEADFAAFENYIQNRVGQKPAFIDDDSIAQAAKEFEETRARKLKEKNDKMNNFNTDQNDANGKLKPILVITKGKLGTKTRKVDPEEEARLAALMNKGNQKDIKGMEEIHWKIVQTKRTIDELRAAIESQNIFEMIYEPYDLYCDKRKRTQIELLKEIIFELKRDFNKEFEVLEKHKNDHIFTIGEKNDQIKDLLENLKEPINIENFQTAPEEKPEHIFELNEKTEINVERFLTKEQREELEEIERKQQEREALLQGDNVGQRGLVRMLGGNELIFKKEKNKIDEELVREDWMNKPESDLTDEEKQKLKDFEQRVKDSFEKQKKQWLVNLSRVRQEIVEIKSRFEEQLYGLYKRRIFYDARIEEQELQIIRLTIGLHDVKETAHNVVKYDQQFGEQETLLEKKKDFVHICNDQYSEFDQRMKNDKGFQEQEQRMRTFCRQEDFEERKILQFIKVGKSTCKVVVPPEQIEKMKAHVISLDPYSEIDTEVVNEAVREMEKAESYNVDLHRHMFGEIEPIQFEQIVHERQMRLQMKQIESKNQERLGYLRSFITHLENEKKKIVEKYENLQSQFTKAVDRQEKLKFNFELIIYLKQGQVEVPQQPVATDYKDAILVSTGVIDHENDGIKLRGNNKVHNMMEILKHNTRLKQIKYEVKRYTLEIEDYKERAKDVQLYRVTKKTQEIIQGKHQKKDEEDKKRLESQMKQLEQNNTNRLKTFAAQKKKLTQEIKDKKRENQELESKARDLRMEVDQRQQIIDLKSATNNDTANDPRKRIMAIATQRKMIDVIKQQEEEIMFLKDELDRLRARTFPSFAHIQNKADYPDEK